MALKILMIYTGGTIGMIEDPKTHTLRPFDFDHLIDNVPKIGDLGLDIDHVQFDPPIDSSNMNPGHWATIANYIASGYDKYDGFVVLHGTDTMAYTASALSFMLRGNSKPVILTGSQLPIGEDREDGTENLITALEIAAARDPQSGQAMVQELAISFNDYLVRGNRATKHSSTNFDTFYSYNYPVLAQMDLHINYNRDALMRPSTDAPLDLKPAMDVNIGCIYLFPGITEANLRNQLSVPGLKGVVLRTFGAGNAPTESWFTDALSEATARGMVIVNVTQCENGGVEEKRYYTGDMLAKAGVISGLDMTFEAASTKLMHLFGQGLSPAQVATYIPANLAGELTPPAG